METENENGRYRREGDRVIIEVAIKNTRQLFNERDPAPFRERDLDENFVAYVVSSVQEFPLQTAMKLQILSKDEDDRTVGRNVIQEAISAYFRYESKLARAKFIKRMREARFFLLIGSVTLFACLGVAQFIGTMKPGSPFVAIAREGLVISGWVAMWRPIEVLLYEWWPMREERLYFDKISSMDIEVVGGLRS